MGAKGYSGRSADFGLTQLTGMIQRRGIIVYFNLTQVL